jgi:uncharacterized protein
MVFRTWAIAALAGTIGLCSPSWSAPPDRPDSLTIGSASPGGVFYIYGQALAPILTEALGIPVTAQATQGSGQNMLLLEGGTVQLGLVMTGIAVERMERHRRLDP